MLITHLERAIAERGFFPGVDAEVTVDVVDALLPANAGRWSLVVKRGVGAATRLGTNGSAGVRIDIRGLAAVYAGFISGREAAVVGLASGGEKDLDRLTAMFAGPRAWMSDMF
jgi:predicted acetyltransferase